MEVIGEIMVQSENPRKEKFTSDFAEDYNLRRQGKFTRKN